MATRGSKKAQAPMVEESLVAQILNELLSRVEKSQEFDPESIERLEHLAKINGFIKAKSIAGAIVVCQEAKP